VLASPALTSDRSPAETAVVISTVVRPEQAQVVAALVRIRAPQPAAVEAKDAVRAAHDAGDVADPSVAAIETEASDPD